MLPDTSPPIDKYEAMVPVSPQTRELANGVNFRSFPYYLPPTNGSVRFVNIYEVEVASHTNCRFGMQFSETGDYCAELTQQTDERHKGHIVCALNCNFGLVTDDPSIAPKDITYNLHYEGGHLYQLPVADKTALLVDKAGQLSFNFLRARGELTLGDHRFAWFGSLTKNRPPSVGLPTLISYGAFNVKLKRITDAITGSKQICDSTSLITPSAKHLTDLGLINDGVSLKVARKLPGGATNIFEYHLVLSGETSFCSHIPVGTRVASASLDGIALDTIQSGTSTGAILQQDPFENRKNIDASLLFQTFHADGSAVITNDPRFCRACVIERPTGFVLLVADARKGIPTQDGLTIDELVTMAQQLYPDYVKLTNVDGGHAAKLAIKRDRQWDLFGNLHYKIWPSGPGSAFIWDGYRGRRIPAVLYVVDSL